MPNRLKWTGLALAVTAGLLIGFALTTFAYRHRILRVPGGGLVERMDRELDLTPAQHHQIIEMMHGTRLKVEQLYGDARRQRQDLFRQLFDQIRGILSPEQQQKFDRDFPPPEGPVGEHHEHHDGD